MSNKPLPEIPQKSKKKEEEGKEDYTQENQQIPTDLTGLYKQAYFNYNPDDDFGEGFTKKLIEKIQECGKNGTKRLVIAQTPKYTNLLGLSYGPTEEKFSHLKKWLTRMKLDVNWELSHSTFNFFSGDKELLLVAYFKVSTEDLLQN